MARKRKRLAGKVNLENDRRALELARKQCLRIHGSPTPAFLTACFTGAREGVNALSYIHRYE
jgi:hypothetical protein